MTLSVIIIVVRTNIQHSLFYLTRMNIMCANTVLRTHEYDGSIIACICWKIRTVWQHYERYIRYTYNTQCNFTYIPGATCRDAL